MNGYTAPDGRQLLEQQRLATQVVMELAMLIEEYLPAEGELLAAVAADVVTRWTAFDSTGGRPELFGPDGFISRYVASVERDGQGRPHKAFLRPGDLVGGHPRLGCGYGLRVWRHHAGWLARIAAPAEPPEQRPDDQDRPAGLRWEIAVERLHTRVAAEFTPLVFKPLDGDRAKIGTIVDDIVAAWLTRGPEDRRELNGPNGPGGFVDGYYSRVYFAKEADGEELFWPQFGPPEGEPFDEDAYARAVWQHHLRALAAAR